MNKYFQILILPIISLIIVSGFPNLALAEPPHLVVHFEQNPLFQGANIVPGDGVSRTVSIINNTDTTQTVITTTSNFTGCDINCLAKALTLTITDGESSYFSGTLYDFYKTSLVELGELNSGETKTFTYTVFFPTDSPNDFQNQSTSFDLVVGFRGGETTSDNPTLIAVGGGGGSGGGGSSGGRHLLFIFNEKNDIPLPETTEATVHWNTNIPATSQVIFGLADNDYVLDLSNLPNLGYPLGTNEDTTKVTDHTMVITGLLPGKTYKYRVVSRASPPTISYEHQFTVPTLAQTDGAVDGLLGVSGGEILGASTENATTSTSTSSASNLAAALASGWNGLLSIWWLWILLLLLLAYLIWRFIFEKPNE